MLENMLNKFTDAKWQIGEEMGIIPSPIMPSSDWTAYQFIKEPQSVPGEFDSDACCTQGSSHSIEAQINARRQLGLISDNLWKLYGDLGFLDANNEFHISVRFSSTMNGTTPQGNDLGTVWSHFVSDGVIPDKDLPFGGDSFETYHDMSAITPNMKAKGRLSKALFSFDYRGNVFMTANGATTATDGENIQKALQIAPILGGIPYPATHCIEIFKWNADQSFNYCDTYVPYLKNNYDANINWGFQGTVTPIDFELPICQFETNLSQGMSGQDVTNVQTILNAFGLLSVAPTGYFGQLTFNAVEQFQLALRIPETGFVGPLTRAALNQICG